MLADVCDPATQAVLGIGANVPDPETEAAEEITKNRIFELIAEALGFSPWSSSVNEADLRFHKVFLVTDLGRKGDLIRDKLLNTFRNFFNPLLTQAEIVTLSATSDLGPEEAERIVMQAATRMKGQVFKARKQRPSV